MMDYTIDDLQKIFETGDDPDNLLPIGLYVYRKILFRFIVFPDEGIKFFGLGSEDRSGWIPMDKIDDLECLELLNKFVGEDGWVIPKGPVEYFIDTLSSVHDNTSVVYIKKNRVTMAYYLPRDKDPQVLSFQRKIYAKHEIDRMKQIV